MLRLAGSVAVVVTGFLRFSNIQLNFAKPTPIHYCSSEDVRPGMLESEIENVCGKPLFMSGGYDELDGSRIKNLYFPTREPEGDGLLEIVMGNYAVKYVVKSANANKQNP